MNSILFCRLSRNWLGKYKTHGIVHVGFRKGFSGKDRAIPRDIQDQLDPIRNKTENLKTKILSFDNNRDTTFTKEATGFVATTKDNGDGSTRKKSQKVYRQTTILNEVQGYSQLGPLHRSQNRSKIEGLFNAAGAINYGMIEDQFINAYSNYYKQLGLCLKNNQSVTNYYKICFEILLKNQAFQFQNGNIGISEIIFLVNYVDTNLELFKIDSDSQNTYSYNYNCDMKESGLMRKVKFQIYEGVLKNFEIWFMKSDTHTNFFLSILDGITSSQIEKEYVEKFLEKILVFLNYKQGNGTINYQTLNNLLSLVVCQNKGGLITKSDIRDNTQNPTIQQIKRILIGQLRKKMTTIDKVRNTEEQSINFNYFSKALKHSEIFDWLSTSILQILWNLFKQQGVFNDENFAFKILNLQNFTDLPNSISIDYQKIINKQILYDQSEYSVHFMVKYFVILTKSKIWSDLNCRDALVTIIKNKIVNGNYQDRDVKNTVLFNIAEQLYCEIRFRKFDDQIFTDLGDWLAGVLDEGVLFDKTYFENKPQLVFDLWVAFGQSILSTDHPVLIKLSEILLDIEDWKGFVVDKQNFGNMMITYSNLLIKIVYKIDGSVMTKQLLALIHKLIRNFNQLNIHQKLFDIDPNSAATATTKYQLKSEEFRPAMFNIPNLAKLCSLFFLFKHTNLNIDEYNKDYFTNFCREVVKNQDQAKIDTDDHKTLYHDQDYFYESPKEKTDNPKKEIKKYFEEWELTVDEILKKHKYNYTNQAQAVLYLCDFVIEKNNCLEQNGKHHYSRVKRTRVISDLIKNYILIKEGWSVIDISFFDYNKEYVVDYHNGQVDEEKFISLINSKINN